MSSNFENDITENDQNTCPYLGLKNDRVTFSSYPSGWNACHHVSPVKTPILDYQRNFCLRANYVNCQIYQAPPGQRMPRDIQLREKGISEKRKQLIALAIVFVMLIAILFGFIYKEPLLALIKPTPEEVSPTTESFSAIQASPTEILATVTPTDQLPTQTPIPPTPTLEPIVLGLDVPIGASEQQFMIHRVAEGESLTIFADRYGTSAEAIVSVNNDILLPLWVESLVVIPINNTDVGGLPKFEPYQIELLGLTPQSLSEKLSVDLDELVFYNNVSLDYEFDVGDWVLVPRGTSQP